MSYKEISRSEKYLKNFLICNGIDSSKIELIRPKINEINQFLKNTEDSKKLNNKTTKDLSSKQALRLISNILIDSYELNSPNVKQAAKDFSKKGYILGRIQKDILKNYFDYKQSQTIKELLDSLSISQKKDIEETKKILDNNYKDYQESANELFLKNWSIAQKANDSTKQADYLLGVYTKLFNILELQDISLLDILEYNKDYIKKELNKAQQETIEQYCLDNKKTEPIEKIAKLFYKKYYSILKEELITLSKNKKLEPVMNQEYSDFNLDNYNNILDTGNILESFNTESYSLVSLNINQELYNQFNNKTDFYNYLLKTIKNIYRILENYCTFTIRIGNIIDNKRNIKWELYSYLGIFCEHFIKKEEKRAFYKPQDIAFDMLSRINIEQNKKTKDLLTSYYLNKINLDTLAKELKFSQKQKLKEFLDNYTTIYYGFTFVDCLSTAIEDKNLFNSQNSEIDFINCNNELLFVFYKYRIDDRKLPCPVCAGLNVSGNSYPEIGHKSFECKNIICPQRSKSNRGKRYSHKSSIAQWASLENDESNIISKDLIKNFRRDIVTVNSLQSIITMMIKYYTYKNDTVLLINYNQSKLNSLENLERKIIYISAIENDFKKNTKVYKPKPIQNNNNPYFEYFIEKKYIKNYLIEKLPQINKLQKPTINSKTASNKNKTKDYNSILLNKKNRSILFKGDCFEILSKIKDESITAAATSPPYYNAREYSQWLNLFLYLEDMYNIAKETYRVLKKGGVYLYNIGDISGNENTIVKSSMGTKRLLLGAYTIQIFKEAGFEIIENILWDKGEPQSNRQKNDGKFTPHYQKPLNAYEHMFLFKKPGAKIILNKNLTLPKNWDNNIVAFCPVIKINSKGENLYGHSAPYPKDIPDFVAKVFTQNKDDIILDPFSGSLTTVISASENNRIGLGIELSEEYVELSQKRAKKENINLKIY